MPPSLHCVFLRDSLCLPVSPAGRHTASTHRLSALVTPAGRSFVCLAQQTLTLISSDHQKGVTVSMYDIQIQPFDIASDFMFSERKESTLLSAAHDEETGMEIMMRNSWGGVFNFTSTSLSLSDSHSHTHTYTHLSGGLLLQYELQRWREGNKEEEVQERDAKRGGERERERKKETGWGVIRTIWVQLHRRPQCSVYRRARCTWASSGANHLGRITGSELL